MVKVGIIGAENSHCTAIAKLCNVEKKVDARVVAVWGETPKFAADAAAQGQIPLIVKDWRRMLDEVDGVMIDHRHARPHFAPAKFFLERGVPCFVDKPFAYTLAEAKQLCALARRKKTPVTSFSILPGQKSFSDFQAALAKLGRTVHLTTTGPVDLKSKYGGVFFYGIHQVDAIIELLGMNVERVSLKRRGANGVATLFYKDGPIVTMYCVNEGNRVFHWSAVGAEGYLDWKHENDPSPYLTGAQRFVEMFRTRKEPIPHRRLLAPVAVLEAMAKALRTGKVVKVAKF